MKLTNEEIQHEVEQEEQFWYYVNKEAEELIHEAEVMEIIFQDEECAPLETVQHEIKEKQVLYRIAEILEKEVEESEDEHSGRFIWLNHNSFLFFYNL